MQIARVIGTVVSTVKNETLDGRKFLIVQTLDADLKETGKPQIALDAVAVYAPLWQKPPWRNTMRASPGPS